jgi:hypothetical protein
MGMVLENSTEVRRENTYEQVESGRGYRKEGNGRMSPYITPPFKVRHHNTQRPPGGCQVCFSKVNRVEGGHIDMVCCAGVFAVEQHYLWLWMDMCVNIPLIVTLVITLELE